MAIEDEPTAPLVGSTRRLALLLVLILCAGCGRHTASRDGKSTSCDSCRSYSEREQQQRRLRCVADPGQSPCHLFAPSMLELLANPSLYDGDEVIVYGFSAVSREDNALYLDAAEAQAAIPADALWLDYHILSLMSGSMAWPDSLNNAYIMVQGTFHAGKRGHLGVFGGEVEVHRVARYHGS